MGRFATWLLLSTTSLALGAACSSDGNSQGAFTGGAAGVQNSSGGSQEQTGGGSGGSEGQTGGTSAGGGTAGSGGALGGSTGVTGGGPSGGTVGSGGSVTGGTSGALGGSGGNATGGSSGGPTGGTSGALGGSGGSVTGGTSGALGGSGGSVTGGAGGALGGSGGDGTGGDVGTGGGGGQADPFEATVVPTNAGDVYSLTFGNTIFTVDASRAGRITGYSLDGENVLVTSGADTGTDSVFWPSPQDLFPDRWPPPAPFDTDPYSASLDGNAITMSSTSDWSVGSTQLGVTKRFWANASNEVVTIEYTIHNNGSSAIDVAPWEVTRVFTGGLTFAAEEAAATRYSYVDSGTIPFTSAQGAAWFLYQEATVPAGDVKTGLDASEGWAAHLHCGTPGLERACSGSSPSILIKQFENVTSSSFAPDQAEVEVYTNGAYVEFEVQGAYLSVPAGTDYTWTVHWYLRALPATVTPETESADLLTFVRGELL